MTHQIHRLLVAFAGLVFFAATAQAQAQALVVTDAQIRFCLSRTDPQCKRVGMALLEQGRIAEGFEISRTYAEQGDTDLQTALGVVILTRQTPGSPPHGRVFGNPRDYAQASRYWFEKAAQNGNPAALHRLARTYCCIPDLGLGTTSSEIQAALPYFRRAAEQGYAPSAYLLGEIYRTGEGVARDRALARSFLRAAAANNGPEATEARTLAIQSLAKIDSDEQAERQKVIDDRLARERSERIQEQIRIADLERAERERIAQAQRIAAEREAARLAKEEEERERPLREARERARLAQAQEAERQQCAAVASVCRGRPDVNLEILEDLSRKFRVARREISVSRTFVERGWLGGCSCTAVFATPVGDYQCGVEQNRAGVVTSARCAD